MVGERKVYTEFLTNLAVAWFSAGVIAPLFTPMRGIGQLTGSVLAIIICFVCMQLAVMFEKGTK
ncbi:MAG: hypothetical protein HYV37_01040 [Candidatus Levyibacteriota bacterium]|nr:MAG: hypothetical protein HYV37_01040 [Candidatus Levybacteria bacterium]